LPALVTDHKDGPCTRLIVPCHKILCMQVFKFFLTVCLRS
jgi:hypothetical protein